MFDVIIVGGGPAGLSAALMLGRCRRRVLLIDSNRPRNAPARLIHGYLTRDGIPPSEFRRFGRRDLVGYGVVVIEGEALGARALPSAERGECPSAYEIRADDGRLYQARKILLATGVVDDLPEIPGFREFYGRGVFHCPYCDAFERSDHPLAAWGAADSVAAAALGLKTWSKDVTAIACPGRLGDGDRRLLELNGVAIREAAIARLEGGPPPDGYLERVVFETGESMDCAALFFDSGRRQSCLLGRSLGCPMTEDGVFETTAMQGSGVRGVFIAGDADQDVQFAIVAAAEGAKAAVAINRELQKEDTKQP